MFKKLFRSRFGNSSTNQSRRLERPEDLKVGDLLTFKHRLVLPGDVQGQTFEVTKVGTYQYEDGLYPQLTLTGVESGRIYLSFKADDAGELSLGRDAPRQDVLRLFEEAAFAALWDDDFVDLKVVTALDAYQGWLGSDYSQVKKWAEGYYYDRDCRDEAPSLYQDEDDDGEELRYHECEDGQFGLTVEVWGDGDTDVCLEVHCTADVIESMWPGEGGDP